MLSSWPIATGALQHPCRKRRLCTQSQQDQSRVFAEEEARLVASEDVLLDLTEQEESLGRQLEQARQKLYHLLAELTRMSSQQEEADRRLAVLADLSERNRQEAVAVTGQLERLQNNSSSLADTLANH